MFRKALMGLLLEHPIPVSELARQLTVPPKELEEDLQHLARSLKRTDHSLSVTPAECRKCGFQFDAHKMHKPSKCPHCRSTWLAEPQVQVVRRAGAMTDEAPRDSE